MTITRDQAVRIIRLYRAEYSVKMIARLERLPREDVRAVIRAAMKKIPRTAK